MTRNTIRQCRACPTWTAPDRARRQDPNLRARYAEHVARGLCRACYEQANRAGTLEDYPRGTWARDELLDEWDRLRALERARKAGDPRARFTWAGVQTATRQRAA
jgi:hypothetical protein